MLDRIGILLAPRDPWGEWGIKFDKPEDKNHGGLTQITMEERGIEGRPRGFYRMSVQPSDKVSRGIYMSSNDHYEISDPANPAGTEEIINMMAKNFQQSIDKSEALISQIMKLGDST